MYLKKLSQLLIGVLLVASTSGCALNYIAEKLDRTERFKEAKANVLSTGELSAETVQELRILFLNKKFQEDPEGTLVTMEDSPIPGRETEQASALAEAAFLHAERLFKRGKKVEAARYYLMASANAYDFLFRSKDQLAHSFVSPFGRNMTELYNAAISKIVDIYQSENHKWTLPWKTTVGKTDYNINTSANADEQIVLSQSDLFLPAYEIRIKGLTNSYKSQGIGAPLVRKQKEVSTDPQLKKFYPPVLSSPVTILFDFSERKKVDGVGHRDVTVSFLNPYKVDTTTIGGASYPIEADFSTSFGVMLGDLKPGALDFDQLINPEKYLERVGLKFIQPYDPEKIPVVFVHGLYSSPGTYIQMVNDLMGVESIRKRYQFWVFGYPTGLPILESSTRLRASLLEAQRIFDPNGTNPHFNQMVLVGHSMGGILSRSMILEGSQHLYDSFVTVPVDKLDLNEKERARVEEMFFFKPVPFIKREVIVASPLRGSAMAQGSLASRFSRWFISLPKRFVSLRQGVLQRNKQYLNPNLGGTSFIEMPASSIDNLRPDSPLLKAYIETPTVPGVPYHTIIGVQDAKVGPGSNDGIVPYESSHLEGAQSEVLVPEGHSCLAHPKTIAEVRRVLLVHLDGVNAQRAQLNATPTPTKAKRSVIKAADSRSPGVPQPTP